MAASVSRMGVFSASQASSRLAPQRMAFASIAPRRSTGCMPSTSRGALVVVAAEKEQKKRTDSAVKRAQLGEDRRTYNRARKSAVATRMKKVLKLAESMRAKDALPKAEDDLKQLEQLIAEASSEIDKAVTKGVLHKNTGDRRKARLSKAKRRLLISAGLYTPAEGSPDYQFFLQLTPSA